ncbi:MAG TPA: LysR substrate-binding domain-containing protein [Steroidobacteraceae bacterium]|nr:LysR substrate-binding domain-containing protein [Steroidobacteraceae bacterium]
MASIIDNRWTLFISVAELGSLTNASAALNVPQSVLSRSIGALERECGARLFRRTGRGVVLTDFGSQIYPRVKQLIAQADQLADDIRTSGGEPLGTVRVGLLPSMVAPLSGSLCRAAAERFPKVRLHLTEGSSVQLEDWLNQGRLDLSMLLREGPGGSPQELTLQTLSLSLIGPPGNPLTRAGKVEFDHLAGLPLVLPGEPHLLRARLDRLARERSLKLTVAMEADSINLQCAIVAAGLGYAIIATPAAAPPHSANVSAALIVNPELPRRVVLGMTLLRPHTHATTAVSQLLQELVPALLPAAAG